MLRGVMRLLRDVTQRLRALVSRILWMITHLQKQSSVLPRSYLETLMRSYIEWAGALRYTKELEGKLTLSSSTNAVPACAEARHLTRQAYLQWRYPEHTLRSNG